MSTGKPQYGSARDPSKPENSIQYRTYYQNDSNWDKNNRTNNYSCNTGHEGEQRRYNRNTRRDNFNNVINLRQANRNCQSNESAETGDILVEVLALISLQTWSTKTVIVPEI